MEWRNHACFCPPLSVMNNLAAQGPHSRGEMVVMGRLDIYGMARSNGLRSPPPPPLLLEQCARVCCRLLCLARINAFVFISKKTTEMSTSRSLKNQEGAGWRVLEPRSLAGVDFLQADAPSNCGLVRYGAQCRSGSFENVVHDRLQNTCPQM